MSAGNLCLTDYAVHEWIGMLAYRFSGKAAEPASQFMAIWCRCSTRGFRRNRRNLRLIVLFPPGLIT